MSTGIASAAWSEEDSCDYRRTSRQESNPAALGIRDNINFLATANFLHLSKATGIFEKVLQYLKIQAAGMLYVGNSEQRAMLPALNLAIYYVHLIEHERFSIDENPLKINSLESFNISSQGPLQEGPSN
jgi:FMN phosphatase YigB (HAD superfamily)